MRPGPILVTGAAGFVGRHLVRKLRVRHPDRQVKTSGFDLTDHKAVAISINQCKPAACFHLAAISNVEQARQDPGAVWQVNLHGTLNLAHALLAGAPECLMVFASSADIYGAAFARGGLVDEATAPAPLNIYGASKAAADLALGALAAEGLRVVRLRPFNHTGPGQSAAFVVAAFARQVARIAAGLQPPLIRVGDLSPRRDFLDVRDVCDAYLACLDATETLPPGTLINLASGQPRRIGEVLESLMAEAGIKADIVQDRAHLRPTDIKLACCDPARARDMLDWTARIPWQQTLRDVLDDWRAQCNP